MIISSFHTGPARNRGYIHSHYEKGSFERIEIDTMFPYGSLRRFIPFRIRNRRNRTCFLHISRYLGPYSPLWASIESRNRFDCPSF